MLNGLELFCVRSVDIKSCKILYLFPYFITEAPQAQPLAPPAHEDATAPPAYVYYGSGAAAQASAPSNLHDSYNNPTYQVNPPRKCSCHGRQQCERKQTEGELLNDIVPFQTYI